mmetsp:Transcript_44854/g.73789  ORF Transcript_44854/g.73789 Transcript_44854/m.73789 type:complete len:281 (+) Transcript_44854:64-906(+)
MSASRCPNRSIPAISPISVRSRRMCRKPASPSGFSQSRRLCSLVCPASASCSTQAVSMPTPQLLRSNSSRVSFTSRPSKKSCSGFCLECSAKASRSFSVSPSDIRRKCLQNGISTLSLPSLGGFPLLAKVSHRSLESPIATAAARNPAAPKKLPERSARSKPGKPASAAARPRRAAMATQSACPHEPRPHPAKERLLKVLHDSARALAKLIATFPFRGAKEMSRAVKDVKLAMDRGSDSTSSLSRKCSWELHAMLRDSSMLLTLEDCSSRGEPASCTSQS